MKISKTLAVNAATAGLGIYAAVENSEWLTNNPWILAALGVVNIGLRCVTTSPLFAEKEQKQPDPIVINLNVSKEQIAEVIKNEN